MRFLWIDDVNKHDLAVESYRFCRVIFGMNCSLFLLSATLRNHISTYYADESGRAATAIDGLHVDDWSAGSQHCKNTCVNLHTKGVF